MGICNLHNLLVLNCTSPPPSVRINQGLARRPMRGRGLSGRLYAEHSSCWEVLRKETSHINATCAGKIPLTGEVYIINSKEQANCMRFGKHYWYFEAGPTSLDPLSCSIYHLSLIQCGAGGWHTRWVERGWGINILEDARHSSVLYICKYFVQSPHNSRNHCDVSTYCL